jgi:hypothetical protein
VTEKARLPQVPVRSVCLWHRGRVSVPQQPLIRRPLLPRRPVAARGGTVDAEILSVVRSDVSALQNGRACADQGAVVRDDEVVANAAPSLRLVVRMKLPYPRDSFAPVSCPRAGAVMAGDVLLRPQLTEQVLESESEGTCSDDPWFVSQSTASPFQPCGSPQDPSKQVKGSLSRSAVPQAPAVTRYPGAS